MKKYLFAIIALMLLVLPMVSCAGSPTAAPGSSDLKNLVITLERTACKGKCPVYALTIYGNGTVVYEGKEFVKIQGRQTTSISEDKIRELVSEFEKIDYFSLSDNYQNRVITDMPSAITSITIGGKTKTVNHYHGDLGAPKELSALEDKIDEIANSAQWTK